MNFSTAAWPRLGLMAVPLVALLGCATLSTEERDAKRAELDAMGEKTIATLLDTQPEAREALAKSIGYVVVDMKVTKVPVVGAGTGVGVVVDRRTGARSYVKVSRFEVGGGLGAQKIKVIVFFHDAELMSRALSGEWHFQAGAEAAAGTAGTGGSVTMSDQGYRAFKLVESGAVATVTVRMAHAEPYLE